ncbi:DUF7344 domain-containing protein [Natrarchaeobaculum aegyptiacum]|uniref:DUF7344 domain-containing protein n=1 Tax=Natrarchaeobaculum aegyptiacum TaxID=745377 RepID=A0A2Z2HZZ7_9EURY|nr:helix-turn-helix transcriptional regulator [Natrarchaeobaculum aegyptiacum]ARS89398.1 hypothetical protein B1756_06305 [Natrarchaeobaculum aegyptiacum]
MSSDAHLGGSSELSSLTGVPAERYDVLRHPHRIRLLEVLEESDGRQSLTELTTALLDREDDDPGDGKRRHEIRIELVHNHLPRLADADLIDWNTEDGAELVAEPPVCPSALTVLLENDHDVEDLVSQVLDPVRLRLLEELEQRTGPHTLEELAKRLATHEPAAPPDSERAKIDLHHSHLPALADVDLLEYDREAGLIEYESH